MEIYQITVYITLSLSIVQKETACPKHPTKGDPAPIIDLLILVDCLAIKSVQVVHIVVRMMGYVCPERRRRPSFLSEVALSRCEITVVIRSFCKSAYELWRLRTFWTLSKSSFGGITPITLS